VGSYEFYEFCSELLLAKIPEFGYEVHDIDVLLALVQTA
jgi:hypothetical protein